MVVVLSRKKDEEDGATDLPRDNLADLVTEDIVEAVVLGRSTNRDDGGGGAGNGPPGEKNELFANNPLIVDVVVLVFKDSKFLRF